MSEEVMGINLGTFFGLVIAAVFLVVIGFAIFSIIKTQLPREIDDATLSSFDEIVRVVKEIEDGKISEKKIPIDINEPFMIAGFNKGAVEVKGVQNPCTKTCLCICDTSIRPVKDVCLKYKDKCVEFEGIHTAHNIRSASLKLLYHADLYEILIDGSKEGLIVVK